MEPTRVEIMDKHGEWQPLNGITNVVVYETPDCVREAQETLRTALRAYAEALRPVLEQIARSFQALREAGAIDEDGKPARRPDRPAWQSPYGPPQRRH